MTIWIVIEEYGAYEQATETPIVAYTRKGTAEDRARSERAKAVEAWRRTRPFRSERDADSWGEIGTFRLQEIELDPEPDTTTRETTT